MQLLVAQEMEAVKPRDLSWPERLGVLFDTHQARLYQLALRLCLGSEDARDLVQEVFLRAARRPALVPERESEAEAWLVTVLVNLCRDRQRKLAVRQRRPLDETTAAVPGEEPNPELKAVAVGTVRVALAQLSARRRAVVVLRDLEELPVREVARLLGIRPVTVRWHHARGLRELAELLTCELPASAEDGRNRETS